MKRDWLIWASCVLLFLAGGIYSNMLPEFVWRGEIGFSDIVSGASAVAAAFAAFAAWRAASVAQRQSFDTALTTRWQMYKMHVDSFYTWLDSIESDQKVVFFKRHELYEIMFPCNRDPSLEFSDKGSAEVSAWCSKFASVIGQACLPKTLGDREMGSWINDYVVLNDFIKYEFIPASEPQFYLDGRIATGITIDKYEQALKVMSNVLLGLSKFSFVQYVNPYRSLSEEFRSSLSSFFRSVTMSGCSEHAYGVGPRDC